MSDTPPQVPPGIETVVRLSSLSLAAPLAALLLAGCVSFQREPLLFDEDSVLSLNPLSTEESFRLSKRDLPTLEGSWVATNRYVRREPATVPRPTGPVTNVSQLRNAGAVAQQSDQKPQRVEVVTTLVIQANTNLSGRGLYGVTIESHKDGKMEGRTAYLGWLVKIKDLLFLNLFPDVLEDSSFSEQADRQHYLPTHWFLKVEAKGKTLEIGRINKAWLSTLLEKRPRSLGHASGIPQVLTDSPEALQQFLQRHARKPEAFTLTTFHRTGGT